MNFTSRRLTAGLIAAAVIVSMGLEPVYAQATPGGPTVGPVGGVPSTTAPSNSQGTPAGGTGVISTTRVGPAGVTPMVGSPATAPMATTAPAPRHRRRMRHRRRVYHPRPAAEIGTQSQMGTNGAVAPSSK